MSFSGDLSGIGLSDVFQNLQANRTTGTLHVRFGGGERFVRFEAGLVAGVTRGLGKGLAILAHVRQRQYVAADKVDALIRRSRKSRKPPGRLLVDAGLLTADEVAGVAAELIQEELYELLLVGQASFEFTEGEPPARTFDPDHRDAGLRLEPGPLLLEAARRADEWEQIRKVVTGDGDLFVVLEGWDSVELDSTTAEVGACLDGATDVKGILEIVPASRFAVLSAIKELVHSGAARPITPDEVVQMAEDALAEGDDEAAVVLIRQTLNRERGHDALRRQLAEILVRQERHEEAAGEWAQLGWDAADRGELEVASQCYAEAIELHPGDLGLHERRVELADRREDIDAVVTALADLADQALAMGVGQRGRDAVQMALHDGCCRDDLRILGLLARCERDLGHSHEAAMHYVQLADESEGDAAIDALREAVACDPEDSDLAVRLAAEESGAADRARRRAQRRSRRMATVAAALLIIGLTVLDRLVAWGNTATLNAAQNTQARAAAVVELERRADTWFFLPAGQEARHIARAARGPLLDLGTAWLSAGQPQRVLDQLGDLTGPGSVGMLQRAKDAVALGETASMSPSVPAAPH